MRLLVMGSTLFLCCLPAFVSAQADKGQLAFNNACRTCHSVKEGDNRLGPSLYGILGNKAASSEGYGAYSTALRNSGIVWDEKTLDAFIANPEKVVPNNNMKPYSGISDPEVRRQIVAYLKSEEEKAKD
ncbi:MAG TPA: c-type cytochrome [Steroidobacteraceae bacterium]